MSYRIALQLLAFFLTFIFSLASICNDAYSASEAVLQPIIVTAARISQAKNDAPQNVTVIDEEMLAKGQYQSLGNLLEVYGFNMENYGPNQATTAISIRGFKSNISNPLESNVLVLVNGSPIATSNIAMIPMDGIEQVEILRGPGAVQYGSSAVGGIINIIPRQGGEKFHLGAEARWGSWGSMGASGTLSGKLGILDFAGSVSEDSREFNYTTGKGVLYPDTFAKSRLHYLMNLGITPTEDQRFGAIILGAYDKNLGMNNSLTNEKRSPGQNDKLDQINSSAILNYDGRWLNDMLNFKASCFNAYQQNNYLYNDFPDSQLNVTQKGGSAQATLNKDILTLTGGFEISDSLYAQGENPDYDQLNTAGFFLAELSFWDNFLVLSGGLRYDSYRLKSSGKFRYLDNTSFNAGIAINPATWLTFRGNFGDSFKVPSGLYVIGYKSAYSTVEPNGNLEPEKGTGWDAGIDVHYNGLEAGISYFSTLYGNRLKYATLPNGNIRYYNASGTSWYNGIEGNISLDIGAFYDWNFSIKPYFNFTKLFNFNDESGKRELNIRDCILSWGLEVDMPEYGFNADLRFIWLGYQDEYDFNSEWPYRKIRTGGKTVGDFYLSKKILDLDDGGKFTIKAAIKNFTNESYAYVDDYPMPGRSFELALRYEF